MAPPVLVDKLSHLFAFIPPAPRCTVPDGSPLKVDKEEIVKDVKKVGETNVSTEIVDRCLFEKVKYPESNLFRTERIRRWSKSPGHGLVNTERGNR